MKDFQLDIYSYKGKQNSVSFAAENIADFIQEAVSGDYLSIGCQKPLDRTWVKASVFDQDVETSKIQYVPLKSASGKYIITPKHGSEILTVVIVDADNVVEALYMAAQENIPEKTNNIEATVFDRDIADPLIQELLKNDSVDVVLLGLHEVTFIDYDGKSHEIPDISRMAIKYKKPRAEP